MKYLVEEESLKAITDAFRAIDYPPNEKFIFPNGFIDGINHCYSYGETIGYNIGMMDGYDDGYSMGYQLGEMDGYDIGYTDGKTEEYERLVDETKLLPTTIQANTILRVDDVSEIPLEGSIKFNFTQEFYICGKNLINPQVYFNDSNDTTLEDDVFTTTFTNGAVYVNRGYTGKQQTHPKGTYTLTFVPVSTGATVSAYVYSVGDRNQIAAQMLNTSTNTFTFTADTDFFIAIGGLSGKYGTHSYKLQLEVGSTATGYEKYKGRKTRVCDAPFTWFCPTTTIYTVYPNQPFTFNYYRSYGHQTAYDAFWDSYQDSGNRTDYINAFSGRGWTENTFKPKYDIYTTGAYMLFRYTGITDLGKALNGKKVIINTDTLQYTFNNSLLEIIDGVEYKKPIKKLDGTFHYSSKLREIRNPIPIDATATKLDGFTMECKALEEIRFSGVIPVSISFNVCKKLSRASIENIVNTLSTTATGQTLTLSQTAINTAFETAEGAADGMVSDDFNALMASRENWTFAFST